MLNNQQLEDLVRKEMELHKQQRKLLDRLYEIFTEIKAEYIKLNKRLDKKEKNEDE